ncbi:hypothetical protein CRG98_021128 [Punica granatum]|uniref:Uncharacterized protein n=1 Tax=Punica granatum TaxID=22663 RepID=A0A2I0JQ99_PUNGR|nr:hypothetical protein CRG98_021128 [Punica granatum]
MESKLALVSRPCKVERANPVRLKAARARWLANFRCRKVHSNGLADRARLQEGRARWLGELAVQESNPAMLQEARARWLANFRCRKVHSNGLADPARLQEARARKVSSHGLAYPTRLQEARARWLGELAVMESKLALTGQGCKRHERGGSANLRFKKVNSHGLADRARLQEARARWLSELAMQEIKLPLVANRARLQEARARWLSELAVQESKLARISRPGKVGRGTSEVARRNCDAGK